MSEIPHSLPPNPCFCLPGNKRLIVLQEMRDGQNGEQSEKKPSINPLQHSTSQDTISAAFTTLKRKFNCKNMSAAFTYNKDLWPV